MRRLSRFVPCGSAPALSITPARWACCWSIICRSARVPILPHQKETVHGFADEHVRLSAPRRVQHPQRRPARARAWTGFDADRTAVLAELSWGRRAALRRALERSSKNESNVDKLHAADTARSHGRQIRARTAHGDHTGTRSTRQTSSKLLFILTMSAATATSPWQFRRLPTRQHQRSVTHIEEWNTLSVSVAGRSDFLYCADSKKKLCSVGGQCLISIAPAGRFVRQRQPVEDAQFRDAIQTRHAPSGTLGLGSANPRTAMDRAMACMSTAQPLPVEGGLVDRLGLETLLTLRQHARGCSRQHRRRSRGLPAHAPAPGLPPRPGCAAPCRSTAIKLIQDKHHVGRYLKVRRRVREGHVFKQEPPRPPARTHRLPPRSPSGDASTSSGNRPGRRRIRDSQERTACIPS